MRIVRLLAWVMLSCTFPLHAQSQDASVSGPTPPGITRYLDAAGRPLDHVSFMRQVHDGKRYTALPSESGHADWAPGTDEELELWKFMRDRHGAHVSVERLLCGNGIGDLYDYHRRGTPELAYDGDRNAAITNAAQEGDDPHAARAVAHFAELLAAECGNVALRALTSGGIVLGGGIPPRIVSVLQTPRFLERFHAKGRFSGWMKTLGVRVALEPRAALLGAAHYVITSKD